MPREHKKVETIISIVVSIRNRIETLLILAPKGSDQLKAKTCTVFGKLKSKTNT